MKFELEYTSSEPERVESSSAERASSLGETRSELSNRGARGASISRATLLFSRILADSLEDTRGYLHRWNARRGGE